MGNLNHFFINPQNPGNLFPILYRTLTSYIYFDSAIFLDKTDACFRFHVSMLHKGNMVRLLINVIRFLKTIFRITFSNKKVLNHIRHFRVNLLQSFMNNRRVCFHGIINRGDDRQRLYLHVNRLDRCFNLLLSFTYYQSQGISNISHHIITKNILIQGYKAINILPGDIFTGQNFHNPGHFLSFKRINLLYFTMGDVSSHSLCKQHPFKT